MTREAELLRDMWNTLHSEYHKVITEENYDVIKKAIKALEQTRWIPVGERLPEENRAVLTYIDTGATKTYCLAYWNDVREAWEEWIGYDLIEKDKGYKVIAWMPLPEPYKEEKE